MRQTGIDKMSKMTRTQTIVFILLIATAVYIGQWGANHIIYGQTATQEQRDSYQELINYCYQHADRPNPLEDLIDKGFLPSGFKETCKSVKQTYDKVQTIINNNLEIQQQKQEAIFKEQQEKEIIVADGQGVRISD
jgi:hypothetical protein